MDKLQAEIKAIQAELQSIRADTRQSHRLLSTLLDASPHLSLLISETASTTAGTEPPLIKIPPAPTSLAQPHKIPSDKRSTPDSHSGLIDPAIGRIFDAEHPSTLEDHSIPLRYDRPLQSQPASQPVRTTAHPQPQTTPVQRLKQLQTPVAHPPEHQLQATLQQFTAQAQQINQLSASQEAALHQLHTIAQAVEQAWHRWQQEQALHPGHSADQRQPLPFPLCDYHSTAVPYLEQTEQGQFVLTTRSIELSQPEQEAAATAQALRQRKEQSTARRTSHQRYKTASQWRQRLRQRLFTTQGTLATLEGTVTETEPFTMRETITLLIGAGLTRVLLNLILSAYPMLVLPATACLIFAASFAVYRALQRSQSSILWGYRCCVIILGLLIGGRL